MRLLVDAHVFDGKYQGTRTYLQGIYQKLISHRDISFFFAARDIKKLKQCFGAGDNINYIQLKSDSSIYRLSIEYPRIIRKYKIDYAHFQYISPIRKYCKEIVTIHDLLFIDYPQYFSPGYRFKNGLLFKRSAKRADILLTVSDYSRRAVSRIFGIPSSQIYVTPNAVLPTGDKTDNPDVKAKYGLDKYLLTVSRIEPRKNHLALLKSFVELNLSEQGYKLMMVGVPDLSYKEFSEYYNTLPANIKQKVVIQSVPFLDLVELYHHANLFVFPSFAEGFGIPPLEAIEYNCPVLCSNATAMEEFHLPTEWTFNPNNINEMKSKIIKLLNNPPDISTERKRLRKEFNWEDISNNLYSLIINSSK